MQDKRKTSAKLKAAARANAAKARLAANTPAARAKAAATRKAKAKHKDVARGIPLDMIPDPPKKGKKLGRPPKKSADTRQEVVLALLKYLNGG
jgi:hypothetical protein